MEDYSTPNAIRDGALRRFQEIAKAKYDAGQREHGGLIIDRELLTELENEVIDLWFYVQGLRIKLGILNGNKPMKNL